MEQKKIILNHLKIEWGIIGYSLDCGFENVIVFEKCKDYIGFVIIFLNAFRKNGEYKTTYKIDEFKKLVKDLENKNFNVNATTQIAKAKQIIEHYYIMKAYLEPNS